MQGKIIFVGIILLLLLLGGGAWFWWGKTKSQKFENSPLSLVEKTEPQASSQEVEAPANETPEPPVPTPQPPKNVSLDSSSRATLPQTDPGETVSKLKIIPHLVSFGFSSGSNSRLVDTIILHSSYNALGGDEYDNDGIWKEWKDAGVSPHYYIDRNGTVYQFVKETDIAWHAGVSKMPDGRTNVNNFSIGIEMDGTQTSGYTDKQYTSLSALIADIKTRRSIKYVFGHADIAPGRKTDPWAFDWKQVKK